MSKRKAEEPTPKGGMKSSKKPKNSKTKEKDTEFTEPLPKRDKKKRLRFPDHPEFMPNLTPKEVLQSGAFGGTYFRNIRSSVTGKCYRDVWKELPEDWIDGLSVKRHLASQEYRLDVNKYHAKCGQTLEQWESSGWITGQDPYGWFQWYCRFYQGRRSADDGRQIARARGVISDSGRFRNQLINKCHASGKSFDDTSVSPVIRQVLLHWGYELTEADAMTYLKKKGKA
eukprot:Clim_evm12s32 gene=Clim_evmTU12s32